MKNHLTKFGFLLVIAAFLAAPDLPTASAQEKPEATPVEGSIDWVFDYEIAKRMSEESGKPIFVVFRCER